MANYFLDFEFIEGFHKPLFGKRRHFIDMISVGLVCQDGRSYYAISNEFRYRDASDWVKENVIHRLPLKIRERESIGEFRERCRLDEHYQGMWYDGKSNQRIALEIQDFVSGSTLKTTDSSVLYNFHHLPGQVDFYGYYSDYDWVLFCSLFGDMSALPKGFPMYCHDLKQTLDETALMVANGQNGKWNFEGGLAWLEAHKNYPAHQDEHNALSDAKWNKKLYEFLTLRQYAK